MIRFSYSNEDTKDEEEERVDWREATSIPCVVRSTQVYIVKLPDGIGIVQPFVD